MKTIQLHPDELAITQALKRTRDGIIPVEYTESVHPDIKTSLKSDGILEVSLTHSSLPRPISLLDLYSIQNVLFENNITSEMIRNIKIVEKDDDYSVELKTFSQDKERALLRAGLKDPISLPLEEVVQSLNGKKGFIYHKDTQKLYLVDPAIPAIELCRLSRRLTQDVVMLFQTISFDTYRMADPTELDLLSTLEKEVSEDTQFGVDVHIFPVEGLKEELQQSETVSRLLPKKETYLKFLGGDYTPILTTSNIYYDSQPTITMSKTMTFVIDLLNDDEIIKYAFEYDEKLSYKACKEHGVPIQVTMEYNNLSVRIEGVSFQIGKKDNIFCVQIGLDEKSSNMLDLIHYLFISRQEVYLTKNEKGPTVYNSQKKAALELLTYRWTPDEFMQLRALMSSRLNKISDVLIADGLLPDTFKGADNQHTNKFNI